MKQVAGSSTRIGDQALIIPFSKPLQTIRQAGTERKIPINKMRAARHQNQDALGHISAVDVIKIMTSLKTKDLAPDIAVT
jgi:hypothetical protein